MGKPVLMAMFLAFVWTVVSCESSKRSHIDNLVKIAKSEKMLEELNDFIVENSFSKTGSSVVDQFGNLNINIVGTYMKVKEIGEVYEKFLKGEEDAAKDLIEAISTLILFDIPGVITPSVEFFSEIINDIKDVPDDDPRKPIQNSLGKMNSKAKLQANAKGSAKGKIQKMEKGFHKMRNYVGQSIDDSIPRLPSDSVNKLKDAGKAVNAYSGGGFAKFGKLITKSGGTMNVLSIMYATYKFGEAADEGDLDSVLEQGLVLAGSFCTLAASFAGAGSILGPIGVVAGVALAAISSVFGIFKPDPKAELKEEMDNAKLVSEKSLLNLYRDFEKLPDLTKSFADVGHRRYKDNWYFECNQYFLNNSVTGLKPDAPLTFKYTGSSMSLAEVSECMKWGRWDQVGDTYEHRPVSSTKCMQIGNKHTVDKSKYNGILYALKGEQDFQIPYDFYGYYNKAAYGGSMIFVRTELLKQVQLRSIDIDTKPPSWVPGSVQTGDDMLILHDLSNLAADSTVSINLRGGNDGVAINGMIGKFSTKKDNIMDIRFGGNGGSDYGGMLSFSGMSGDATLFETIKKEIKGVEYHASVGGGRGKVCFHWGKFGRGRSKGVSCPIKVSDVAIFGSSPLNDIIHLNSQHNMFVISEEGHNIYKLSITREDRRRTFQIVDKATEPAIIEVSSTFEVKVVYKEKERSYEFYISEEVKRYRPSGLFTFKTKIVYKGSKNTPRIKLPTGEVQPNEMLGSISETNKDRVHQGAYAATTVHYTSNVVPSDENTPAGICLCPPQDQYPEGYWGFYLSSHVDAVVVSNVLKRAMQSTLKVKLIYDKVAKNAQTQAYDYGWLLQIREKADLADAGTKRLDVRLQNSDVVWTDDQRVLADLTDPYSLTNEIDLKTKEKTTYLFEHIESKTHDGDETVILKRHINTGNGKTFSLGGGTNTVVYDTTKNLQFDYKITEVPIGTDDNGNQITTLDITVYDRSKEVKFEDVDRFICQFNGGLQRDLNNFADGYATGKRTLEDDCRESSPYGRREKFHGKSHATVTTGMCDARCR